MRGLLRLCCKNELKPELARKEGGKSINISASVCYGLVLAALNGTLYQADSSSISKQGFWELGREGVDLPETAKFQTILNAQNAICNPDTFSYTEKNGAARTQLVFGETSDCI